MFRRIAIAFALVLPLQAQHIQTLTDKINAAHAAPTFGRGHTLTVVEQEAVVQAVEDEVYDNSYQGEFYDIGNNTGTPDHWISKVPLYISPSTDKDGFGHAIYRLMPHGEVYRLFVVRKDGMVVLVGDPFNGFPITQPSELTIFMDDEDICSMKRRWHHSSFLVDNEPPLSTIKSAADREEIRTGMSEWKSEEAEKKPLQKKQH